MIQTIQVSNTQWSEIQLQPLANGNYTLINYSQEVVYLSEVADPQNLDDVLTLGSLRPTPTQQKSYWVKSKYAPTEIKLASFNIEE